MKNNKLALIVVIAVALFALFFMPFGSRWGGLCGMMSSYGTGSYGWGGMMGGFAFGWLFMLAFLIVLILLIIWLVQQVQKPQAPASRRR